ncbi:hypothetical protein, partial [Staphylococcus aureus]
MLVGASWHQAPGLQLFAAGPSQSTNDDYMNRLRLSLSSLEPVATDSFDYLHRPIVDFITEELSVP